ncbi:MAG TPA: superinfection immunity protein [Stellaceae bacterium]|nr:superinfection immunity protein [Stellaceae bacterium]
MSGDAVTVVPVLMIAVAYMLPTLIAYARDASERQTIVIVNLAFGWTLIGWIVALMWATHAPPAAIQLWKRRSP